MTRIVPNDGDPIWLRVAYGELSRGVRERRGPEDDPSILDYLSATNYGGPLHDEVPWCSAFACWCMEQAGVKSPRAANARSWLDWGEPLTTPRRGAIAVFARGAGELAGHVGFWLQSLAFADVLLGGNQADAVSVAPCQRAGRAHRLLGYRWPAQIGR